MPDLDLIKQVEQECATGACGQSLAPVQTTGGLWVSACARRMISVRKIFCFPPEEDKGDTGMNCPNESEH
jgi:hypothetical protein